ncbi:MAG: tetratricopeptide repeat protein [Bacteroidota bacterium]
MNKDEQFGFLSKLTVNELKSLAKQLNINIAKGDKKDQVIEKIVSESSIASILEKLGISDLENESLEIAKKGLINQKRQRIITSIGVLTGLVALLVTLYINRSKIIPSSYQLHNQASLFQNPDSYNILLLPFGSSQKCELETIICEREVEERFNLLKEQNDSLNIEVQVYQGVNTTTRSLAFDRARSIGDSLGADLVVWGDYQSKCEWDSTKIRVKWASVETDIPFLDPQEDIEYQGIQDLSQIEEGEVTGNVEEIVYWALARKDFSSANFGKSLAYLLKIKAQEKIEYAVIFNAIGRCYHELDQQAKAAQYYSKAIELNPENADFYNNRGYFFHAQKRYAEALVDYNKAIALNPGDANFYNNRGELYKDQERYAEALTDYNKAIELGPKHAVIYNNRGHFFYAQKRYVEALADYNKAIALNPGGASFYNNRGGLYEDQDRYEEALADLSTAIDLGHEDVNTYYLRGKSYEKLGEKEKARMDLEKVGELRNLQK